MWKSKINISKNNNSRVYLIDILCDNDFRKLSRNVTPRQTIFHNRITTI